MSGYLGLYFSQRPRDGPLTHKAGWAACSTVAASIVELPFDKAKTSITQGWRMAAFTSVMRVPLSSMLLVAYDTALDL